jgi:hypothetical protein
MESIERKYSKLKVFSLPSMGADGSREMTLSAQLLWLACRTQVPPPNRAKRRLVAGRGRSLD